MVRRFSAMAEDIACRPALGPYETGVLEELVALLRQVTGLDEEAEHQAQLRRYDWKGQAVDFVPSRALDARLGRAARWPSAPEHLHIA